MAVDWYEWSRKYREEQAARQPVQDLYDQSSATQKNAELIGAEQPGETLEKPSPGFLSRVFDVISRPIYAVAEGVKDVFDPEGGSGLSDVGAFFKGAGQGITGKEKTSFADVLGEHGHTGVTKYLGGFALDVLLDPTTYLTGGLSKATKFASEAGKEAAEEIAKRAVSRTANTAAHINRQNTFKSAFKALEKEAIEKGEDITSKEVIERLTNKANEKAHEAFVQQLRDEGIELQRIAKESLKPRATEIRFMGKKVLSSQKASDFARKVADVTLAKSETARRLNSALRTRAGMDPNVHRLMSAVMGEGYSEFDKTLQAIKAQGEWGGGFGKISKADDINISHALEQGLDSDAFKNLSPQAQEFAKWAKGLMDEWFQKEMDAGLHLPGEKIENYVYHQYKNQDAARKAGVISRRYAGPEAPGFSKPRTYFTLEEAKLAGLNPEESISRLLAARAQKHYETMNRAYFIKELTNNFGVKVANPFAKAKILETKLLREPKSRFLPEGYVFDKEIADVIERIETLSVRDPETRHFVKMFDKIQNQYKFLVTAPNPGFHVRNLMGDVWNNFMDGVVNPVRYKQAAGYLNNRAGIVEKTVRGVPGIKEKHQLWNWTLPDGTKLDAGDMEILINRNGLKTGYFGADVSRSVGVTGPLGKPGKAVSSTARKASEYREDFARTAHFLDALHKEAKAWMKKNPGKKINKDELLSYTGRSEIAQAAADRVRKFNFDYQDLTEFEKAKLKRIVPFYTWMRKNIPLQFEMLATKPGRLAAVPKGTRILEKALGTDMTDEDDPFPGLSNVVPQWIREMAPIRLDDEGFSTTFLAPQLPFQDIAKYLEEPAKFLAGDTGFKEALGSQLANVGQDFSPLLTTPVELALGKTFFGQRPIQNLSNYFASKLPQARGIQAVTALGEEPTAKNKILNYLLGLGIHEATPQLKKGEIQRIKDPWDVAYAEQRKQEAGAAGLTPEVFYRDVTPTTASNRVRRYNEYLKTRSMSAYDRIKEQYGF